MEVASKDIPVAAQNDAKTCPKCESRVFYPVNFPGTSVVIDICKNCKGVWFDKGELHAIKKAVIDEETGEQDKHEAASEKIAAWVNKILESLKAY